ncbi:MAG: RND family transporter [Velocimicrobium sp.]
MEKIFQWIVKHRKLVLVLFFLIFVISLICSSQVKIDYNLNNYLPSEAPSTLAIDTLGDEFGGAVPNVKVMISNVTIPEALEYKERINKIEGVIDVIWLDNSLDLTIPLEIQDAQSVETYYKNGAALYNVTVEEENRVEAIENIENLLGEDDAMSGAAVNTTMASKSTTAEIHRILMFIVPVCILILLLTTNSYFEPLLLMLTIGISIVLNSGTNLIFGSISFITNSAGTVLQLAVSIDYSLFLMQRFEEYRKNGYQPEEAMVKALCKSLGSVASSGLTTIIGFLALMFMQFKVGPDLGRVLAKGICFSLLTVFVFLPAITLCLYKVIDKTTHKPFFSKFEHFGKFVYKIKLPMVLILLLLMVPAYLGQNSNSFNYGSSKMFGEDTEVAKYRSKIEETFGKTNTMVLMVKKADLKKEEILSESLKEIPEIVMCTSYVDNVGPEIPAEYLDEDQISIVESENYSRFILTVNGDLEGNAPFALVKKIRQTAEKIYPNQYYLAGESVSTYDIMDTVNSDGVRVNLIAISAIFLILVINFQSIFLPLILVLSIETAIWLNLMIPYLEGINLFYIGYLIISSVMLGATVDYAILEADRYLEFRKIYTKKKALIETISIITLSILTSAMILTSAGFLLHYISTNFVIAQLGLLIARGTIFSTMVVLLVLPGMLFFFDKAIEKTTYKCKFYTEQKGKMKDEQIKEINTEKI